MDLVRSYLAKEGGDGDWELGLSSNNHDEWTLKKNVYQEFRLMVKPWATYVTNLESTCKEFLSRENFPRNSPKNEFEPFIEFLAFIASYIQ